MKRSELVREISRKLRIPKIECDRMLDALQESIAGALVRGDKVSIRGFATFEVSERKEREGYNPHTGELEHFAPSKQVVCKVSQSIKELINEKQEV